MEQSRGEEKLTSSCVKSVTTSMRRGRCKWFNVTKGWGFVTPDDGDQDVFVHQSVIRMSGFRSLAEGEEVELETKLADKGVEATFVTGPGGSDCRGTQRHSNASKKTLKSKRIRCFNCGIVGSHVASKCAVGTQPKRCHQCKSEDHLVATCPKKQERHNRNQQSQTNKLEHMSSTTTKEF